MPVELIAAFVVFAFVGAATPGPNNFLLLASGIRAGFRRTLPFVFGISVGFATLLALVGAGLGQLFLRFPQVQLALKVLGTAYFFWLAWKIVTAPAPRDDDTRPLMGFWTGAAFQYVNPKAWLICITAVSLYLPSGSGYEPLLVLVVLAIAVGMPANLAWAGAGQGMRRFITSPIYLRRFNLVMAALLVLSIIPVWLS
jgi:threonine/homoserine/homoserine lactone efflux protein